MEIPWQIDAATAARLLQAGAVLLDVREPDELTRSAIPGARAIPLREIPAALDRLPRDTDLLVLCHHGARSGYVTQYLRAHGFSRATNVTGGIEAWAVQVDPTLPRY